MNRLIGFLVLIIGFTLASCGGNGQLKKDMLEDVNTLCKCQLDIQKGNNIAECGKKQTEIRDKYKAANDLLIELDDKVKKCFEDNQK